MANNRILEAWPGAAAVSATAVAVVATIGVVVAMTAGAGAGARQDDPARYTAADMELALSASCAVTGCDATALAAVYRVGLPAMTDEDLAESAALADLVARASASAVAEAADGSDARHHAILAAQAAADAAIARLHAAEAARRAEEAATG